MGGGQERCEVGVPLRPRPGALLGRFQSRRPSGPPRRLAGRAYYGDPDGEWPDAVVDSSKASRAENKNVPGDGKFDPDLSALRREARGRPGGPEPDARLRQDGNRAPEALPRQGPRLPPPADGGRAARPDLRQVRRFPRRGVRGQRLAQLRIAGGRRQDPGGGLVHGPGRGNLPGRSGLGCRRLPELRRRGDHGGLRRQAHEGRVHPALRKLFRRLGQSRQPPARAARRVDGLVPSGPADPTGTSTEWRSAAPSASRRA